MRIRTFTHIYILITSADFLFVCVEFIVPLENFSLTWRRHHCRWRAANFDLCSVLMAMEQWGFFNVPHLLWQGPTLYKSHHTHTQCRAFGRKAVATFFLLLRWSNPDLPHVRWTISLYATAAVIRLICFTTFYSRKIVFLKCSSTFIYFGQVLLLWR